MLHYPEEPSDKPTDISLHHEPSEEPSDMPHLESQCTTIPSTPYSPFGSTMSPPSSPPAVRQRRHLIVLLIPLLFFLIFKQYEVSEHNNKRSLHWSTIAKNRRKKKRILWSKVNERISDNQFRRCFAWTASVSPCSVNVLLVLLVKRSLSLSHALMHSLKAKITCYRILLG